VVRIVVPFAPGALTDVAARSIAAEMSEQLGQQFVVENKGGAGGTLGAADVAKSAADGHTLVTAYALKRPDGQWSLLLINKDFDHAHPFRLKFHDETLGVDRFLAGRVTAITFGKAQYQWHPARRNGYADPDGPPVSNTVNAGTGVTYTLPPASLNIICGRLAE